MSNNKQTAVDYLVEQLFPKALSAEQYYHIEQAKAMHKEETIKLYYAYEDYVLREEGIIKTFGQFYNETFGSNND
jgi:hypothetical protein